LSPPTPPSWENGYFLPSPPSWDNEDCPPIPMGVNGKIRVREREQWSPHPHSPL